MFYTEGPPILPILLGIQPAELRRLGATLSLARRGTLDPDHILHVQLAESSDVHQKRLKSRRSFVPAARKLLSDLSNLGIRAAQRTNYRWSAEYSKRISVFHVLISRASSRLLGMGLPKHLGLSSIVCGLALDVFISPFTNGVSLPRSIASVAPPLKPQTTLS